MSNPTNDFMKLTNIKRLYCSITAFFLGLIFITAGISKITTLPGLIGPVHLIDELAKHDLELYGKFIAASQMVIGFLLLTNRFRLIGSIMLVPMLLNILTVVISLNWNGTPYVVSFLFLINLSLLVLEWHKLKVLITQDESELRSIKIKREAPSLDLLYLFFLLPLSISIFIYQAYPSLTKTICKFSLLGILFIMLIMNGVRITQHFRKRKLKTDDKS